MTTDQSASADVDAAANLRANLGRIITGRHISVGELVAELAEKDPAGRGISETTIYRFLAGQVVTRPRAATVRKLAALLGTTPAALLAAPPAAEPVKPACVTDDEWAAIREAAIREAAEAPPLTDDAKEVLRNVTARTTQARNTASA